MSQSTKFISPLRQRMIEDMTLRKFSPKTQTAYIRAVANFTRFLGRSPDTAEAEDLRRYQLHLVEQGGRAPPAWRLKNAGPINLGQLKVMAAVEHCRSAEFGGHVLRCDDCATVQIAYNSCRNRHCPKPVLSLSKGARVQPPSSGSPSGRRSSCHSSTTTWCSPCPRRSATSPIRTKP